LLQNFAWDDAKFEKKREEKKEKKQMSIGDKQP
jgi:hypothetical protein